MAETPHTILHPPTWPKPRGYANGIAARGQMVFVGGQVGWLPDGKFAAADFLGQTHQALLNIAAVLNEAGARPEHIVRLTWYVVDMKEYRENLRHLGPIYRQIMGRHFPAMALVQVVSLAEPEARVEIKATAVVPDGD